MAQYKNNRNNGDTQRTAPSMAYSVGDFIVPNGIGSFMPYQLATTVTTGAFTGTFVLGEAVSQATSGATGVILAIGTQKLVIGTVTGTFDGSSHVITGGTSGATAAASAAAIIKNIMGVCNEEITSSDPLYATSHPFNLSTPVNVMDYLTIPVSSGTATSVLEGTYVDVDPANPGKVIVSSAGTQIFVTKVINSALIEGIIALTV